MTDPDSDLWREVEGKMREREFSCPDAYSDHPDGQVTIPDAVSVAVELVKAAVLDMRGTCPECSTSYRIVTFPADPPTEPPRESECPRCGSKDPNKGNLPCQVKAAHPWHPSSSPGPQEECGCGTTGCTEHLPPRKYDVCVCGYQKKIGRLCMKCGRPSPRP